MSPKSSAKTSTTIVTDARCQYVAASGRRCRTHASRDTTRASGYSAFCLPHAQMEQQFLDSKSVTEELIGEIGDFRTNTVVNEVLGNLLKLVAENRIPLRNANSISYICQLLLSSHEGVRRETHLVGGEKYEIRIINDSMDTMWGKPGDDEEDAKEKSEREKVSVPKPEQEQAAPINSFEDLVAAGVKLLDGK
jgi:hypothetical protein